jgi:hypothetical protein
LDQVRGHCHCRDGGCWVRLPHCGVYFEKLSDTRLQFVPYRGTGPALLDMIAGRIDVMVDQVSNSAQQVRDGKIRAYAVTAKTRLAAFPNIPTVDEAGLPGLYINIWHGLWAPAETPKEIIAKLDHAAVAALADADTRERPAGLGLEIPAQDQQTSAALGALQRAEIEKWRLLKAFQPNECANYFRNAGYAAHQVENALADGSRVRFAPESGHRLHRLECQLSAKSGVQQFRSLLDHLISARK